MISLAQGSAGLAMAFGVALIGAAQMPTALILLIGQALAVACAALARHEFGLAALAVIVNGTGAAWLLRGQVPRFVTASTPEIGGLTALAAAVVLAGLCQSRGILADPLAMMLLAVLFAATRRHTLVPVTSLLAMQNALVLTVATVAAPLPMAAAGFLLALAPALLLLPPPRWHRAAWVGGLVAWGPFAVSVLLLAASLVLPLDPIGRTFAPLVAAWGAATAWTARTGPVRLSQSIAAVVTRVGVVAAVATSAPLIGVSALALALAATRLPIARRRPDALLLGLGGAGLALFGLLSVGGGQPAVSFAMLFLGLGAMTVVATDLAAIAGILLLRLAVHGPWPVEAATVLSVAAVLGLIAGALALLTAPRPARTRLLRLCHLALVAAALSLNDEAGRLAALFLLVLALLTDMAARLAAPDRGPAAIASSAGLAGIAPLGIFPAVAMLVVAVAARTPWLLLPMGLCLAAMARAGLPTRLPAMSARPAIPSLAWAPLCLALAFGYAAPTVLIRWLTAVTMVAP